MLENLMVTLGPLLAATTAGKAIALVLAIVCFVVAVLIVKKMKSHGESAAPAASAEEPKGEGDA